MLKSQEKKKTILKLVIASFLSLNISLSAKSTNSNLEIEYKNLSNNQKATLIRTFYNGKSFDYGYTMAAIAWQESHFGKYLINLNDPSCGVFHVMPKYVGNRKNSKWTQSRICERLITDYKFSFSSALERLKYFENYWKSKGVKRVWSHTVSSYNQGFNYRKNSEYLKAIKEKIRFLKKKIK